ncbi:hypothetical protein ONA23_04530 [Mycoplasmopsis cynos]|uniref:hypothetical protein n=1 Tax=Mycoplasmopsis cynos TaxID=171284 RepID=UPI0024C9F737|nr:hypothetical protein [Mycoplasmopsis cynos]WAM06258.1 hypothetical protein ONA23_04530 [Mycoplasmopsis cynos]
MCAFSAFNRCLRSFSEGSEAKIVNIKLGNSLKDKNKQQEFEAEVNKLLKQRGSKFSVKFSFDGDTDAYQTNKDDILKGTKTLFLYQLDKFMQIRRILN